MKEFESPLEDYPGSFGLPDPFLAKHVKAWWSLAVEPLKGVSRFDFEFYDGEWKAVVELIQKWGAWNVEGVPPGDLLTDDVPAAVQSWVMKEADGYIYPFLPPKALLRQLGIT